MPILSVAVGVGSDNRMGLQAGGHRFDPGTLHFLLAFASMLGERVPRLRVLLIHSLCIPRRRRKLSPHETSHTRHGDNQVGGPRRTDPPSPTATRSPPSATIERRMAGSGAPSLDGRRFRHAEMSAEGEGGAGTVFEYHEQDGVVWARYQGGAVRLGFLVGVRKETRSSSATAK